MSKADIVTPSIAEAALLALNEAYIEAARARDASWFREHMADDCIVIFGDGRRLRKAAFLANVAEQPKKYTALTTRDVTVRVFGPVAQIDAEAPWELENGSAGVSRYIDTYVWSDGGWRVISAQITWLPSS